MTRDKISQRLKLMRQNLEYEKDGKSAKGPSVRDLAGMLTEHLQKEQKRLAKAKEVDSFKTEISHSTISAGESGEQLPRLSLIRHIASFYEADPVWLLTGRDFLPEIESEEFQIANKLKMLDPSIKESIANLIDSHVEGSKPKRKNK